MTCACGCGATVRRRFVKGHNARVKHPRARQGPDYIVDPETGCWNWQHAKTALGYGQVTRPGGRGMVCAHRMVYERDRGPVPAGLELDHLCRNPSCVNPAHLEPVTHLENVHRGRATKLSREDVVAIRASTLPNPALGERYGVRGDTISKIRNYRHRRNG